MQKKISDQKLTANDFQRNVKHFRLNDRETEKFTEEFPNSLAILTNSICLPNKQLVECLIPMTLQELKQAIVSKQIFSEPLMLQNKTVMYLNPDIVKRATDANLFSSLQTQLGRTQPALVQFCQNNFGPLQQISFPNKTTDLTQMQENSK